MKTVTNRKNRYQQQLRTYLQRRAELKASKPYCRERLRKMNAKIAHLYRMIRIYEDKLNTLKTIDSRVVDFIGYSARSKKTKKSTPKQELAVSIFIKQAYDLQIDSRYINQYLKYKDARTPSNNRRTFTRSFKTNPENYRAWQNFRQYLSHNKI